MDFIKTFGQWLIFLPAIFCFSYVLRPMLLVLLIPGGLLLLAILGGQEVRQPLFAMLKEQLWSGSTRCQNTAP
nr:MULTISPECIES: hypothetical protein [unclassified Vibrio]